MGLSGFVGRVSGCTMIIQDITGFTVELDKGCSVLGFRCNEQ